MTYKRYTGTVEYSSADGILWGRVLGIKAMIDYEGESVAELRKDFEAAIDHYLAICKKRGIEPDKPLDALQKALASSSGKAEPVKRQKQTAKRKSATQKV